MKDIDILHYLVQTENLISSYPIFGERFVIKGGTALMSRLIDLGRTELGRKTTDIDLHCPSQELWRQFYTNVEAYLNNNKFGYEYKVIKRRGATKSSETSDSLELELVDNGNAVRFKIDINFKPDWQIGVEFAPLLNMKIYDLNTQLADKIVAVSSKAVYRRIKDVYDIAVLASLYSVKFSDIKKRIAIKFGDIALTNMLKPENYSELLHAYNKFEGIYNKPRANIVFATAVCFLAPFYSREQGDMTWAASAGRWITE